MKQSSTLSTFQSCSGIYNFKVTTHMYMWQCQIALVEFGESHGKADSGVDPIYFLSKIFSCTERSSHSS